MCLTPMSQTPVPQDTIKIPEPLEHPPLVIMCTKLSLSLEQREHLKPSLEIQTKWRPSWTTSDRFANDIELRGPRRNTRPSFPTATPRCRLCYTTSLQLPNRIWTSLCHDFTLLAMFLALFFLFLAPSSRVTQVTLQETTKTSYNTRYPLGTDYYKEMGISNYSAGVSLRLTPRFAHISFSDPSTAKSSLDGPASGSSVRADCRATKLLMDRCTQCVTQTTMLAQIKDRGNQGSVAEH